MPRRLSKYLYLTKAEWVDAWVDGGRVPLALASRYLSDDRAGTSTPDEGYIQRGGNRDARALPCISFEPRGNPQMGFESGGDIVNVRIGNIRIDGVDCGGVHIEHFAFEDGLVLCLCNGNSAEVAKRLGKVAVVQIGDVAALRAALDAQIGAVGQARPCEYTDDHQRNPFLKGRADQWQDEYRLYWPGQQREREVEIPTGTGRVVTLG